MINGKCAVLFLGLAFLTSCNKGYNINYVVDNQSTTDIEITYSTHLDNFNSNFPMLNTIVLNPNQQGILYIHEVLGNSSVINPESAERLNLVVIENIRKIPDNTSLVKDANLKENWLYDKRGKNVAVIELTVADSDFLYLNFDF